MQSSGQIVTTNKPTLNFYRPDALPVPQSTVLQHWRDCLIKITVEYAVENCSIIIIIIIIVFLVVNNADAHEQ